MQNPNPPNKRSVETTPIGSMQFLLTNVSSSWSEESRTAQLSNAISNAMHDVIKTIPICQLLRLIVFSANPLSEIVRWQRELGLLEGVTSGPIGEVLGKTLVWGSGELDASYAVIIFPETIALGLLDGDDKLQPCMKGTLVHELAHVHDEVIYLKVFGRLSHIAGDDWPSLRRFYAHAVWGEYFANSVAFPYLKQCDLDAQLDATINFFELNMHRISQAISTYRVDNRMDALWQFALNEMTQLYSQLGRVIALAVGAKDEGGTQLDKFLVDIDERSVAWGAVVRHLTAELTILEGTKWESNSLDQLKEVIDEGFQAAGFYPKYSDEQFWIDVPFA